MLDEYATTLRYGQDMHMGIDLNMVSDASTTLGVLSNRGQTESTATAAVPKCMIARGIIHTRIKMEHLHLVVGRHSMYTYD